MNKQMHLLFPDTMFEQIKEKAEALNISMSAVIKIAVADFLKKEN